MIALAEVKTFNYSNYIVRVHFPDLTEDERKHRQKQLVKAAVDLMKSVEECKREEKKSYGL